MIHSNAAFTSRRTLLLLAKQQRRHQQSSSSSSALKFPPSARRFYSSSKTSHKKDLPPPLPPRGKGNNSGNTHTNPIKKREEMLSPAKAKKEYLEAQKRTGEFLKDPQASILRLQSEMNETKAQLLSVHDKPIWRRVVDRLKAKRHSVLNLLCASMAYILAHRLHLKMKENQKLQEQVDEELAKNAELRTLLRSITTEEFVRGVLSEATTATSSGGDDENENGTVKDATTAGDNSSSSWWRATNKKQKSASSSSLNEDLLVDALRTKLQARIGDEGLEDAERKEKNMEEIWKENEKRIEESDDGLSAALAAVALEEERQQQQSREASALAATTTSSSSKRRVFDM